MRGLKHKKIPTLCFFAVSVVIFLFTAVSISRLCQRIPDKMLSLQKIDIRKIPEAAHSDTEKFSFGYRGTWEDDLLVNGKVYKNIPISFASPFWLEEAMPSASKDVLKNFLSSDYHMMLDEDFAEKLGVHAGSTVEISGEIYTVSYVSLDKDIYLSGLPKEAEVSDTEAIFGYTDGETLYKKEAVHTLYSRYQLALSEKDIMDMQPWKALLQESWKLYFAVLYLIAAAIVLRKTALRLYHIYAQFHEESRQHQAGQIALCILQIAALLLIWYFIINHIDIPQQCISPDRILDLGFYFEKVKQLFTSPLLYQNVFLRYMKAAGLFAVIGYSTGILSCIISYFCLRLIKKRD